MQLQTPGPRPRLLKLPLLFPDVFETLVTSMGAFVGKAVLSGQRVIDLQTSAGASRGGVYAGICQGLMCLLSMLRASCLWCKF